MKKKSILGRIGIVAAALTLATTSMMSGTLARYQSSADVYAGGIVARWAAKVTDDKDAAIGADIELASLMNANDGKNKVDFKQIGSSAKAMDRIAPGTKGSTKIKVNVTGSEVPVLMTMTADLKGSGGKTYVMPNHITLKVIDDATGNAIATLSNTYSDGNWKSAFDSETGTAIILGKSTGTQTAFGKPQLFKSTRENGVQVKTYTLEWEWPLDYDGTTDKNKEAYDKDDLTYATKEATTARTFGFHLNINLEQADKNIGTEGTDYTVVVAGE